MEGYGGTYNYSEAIMRFRSATHTEDSMSSVARYLDMTPVAVHKAFKRCSLPANWLICALIKDSVNPGWVLYGDNHAKYLAPCQACA